MKRKYETRYFVTDVASIPVIRVYGKTEMYRQAAKDGWGVVYRDENNTLVCDEDSSANFFMKNGGYYGISGNDEVITKEMPKQSECAAIIVSDSCGFTFWAEDFSQIHFFVTYDANGLVDSYRIEYGDGPIYDGEVEVSFEGLFEQPECDWQESYRAEIPGTIEYQNKREADKLAEESGETWMDSKQREQFRRVCGKIDRIKSAWDFWVTMQSLEYDFDKKIINTARNYKKCYNFTQYEQPQEVARRDELMECYEKYALAAEDTTEAGAEAMQMASCARTGKAAPTATGATLTEEEAKFFNDTVARIKYSVNVRIPIEPMDHEQLSGKSKEALGICWAEYDEAGKPIPFRITIDKFFIHECFVALEKPYMKIEPQTLEQVIAHEIAHIHVWRHGKKHTELTARICRLIEKGEPHGLEDRDTAPVQGAGQVTTAAMHSNNTHDLSSIRGERKIIMTKTEYTAAIEADLTAANALCAELRTLRNFKKIAKTIADADKLVSFEVLDKTITGKEAELQKLRSALGKNRRIVKKLEEIEAIETGEADAPKPKKNAAQDKSAEGEAKGKKATGKKGGAKAAQGKANADAPEQEKSEQPAA